MVSWEYPPLVVGGLGRHVGALTSALVQAGHEVRVLTRGDQQRSTVHTTGAVTVVRAAVDGLSIDFGSAGVLSWAQAFEHSLVRAGLELLGGWKPEIIHGHDWLVAQTGHTLRQVSGAPLVVTSHATEWGRQQGWLSSDVAHAVHSVERWQNRNADAVIVCSRFMADQVGALFDIGPEQLTVIGNGIDPALVSPSAAAVERASARFAGGRPRLLFVGRLVHEKGLQELIKALPLLREGYPNLRLVIAGTGPMLADQVDRARRYGVADLIDWAGFVGDADLAGLLAGADVLVVPSLYEPFGLIALEAQAAGTAVAVADTGGLRELVEPGVTGERFLTESPAALASAVDRLLSDPVRATEQAERAKAIAERRYGWAAVATRTAEVYSSLHTPSASTR
jgi:glycogen(starch) synthase